jgi:putative SOS response-associated peptidase YedK
MAPIRDRMPVIVPPADCSRWLSSTPPVAELRPLLEPSTEWSLDAYPVPPFVDNVRNNGAELLQRLQPPPEPLALL